MPIATNIESLIDAWFGLGRPHALQTLRECDYSPDTLDAFCNRCGSTVGPGEVIDGRCGECRHQSFHFDRLIRLGSYQTNKSLQSWVIEHKYQRWVEIGRALGVELASQLVSAIGVPDRDRTIVVPVPMPWQRRMFRGIDHARVLAGAAARELDLAVAPVLRKNNGPTQVSLTVTERRTNLRNRVAVARRRLGGRPMQGAAVILVDDIKTTGSTLNTCARLLKRAMHVESVVAAVVAVSDSPARRARHQSAPADSSSSISIDP